MEKKKHAKTPIQKIPYEYLGSLEEGLRVFKASADHKKAFHFTQEQIKSIKSVMLRICPAKMGGRINPIKYSIGNALYEETGINPQSLCYVIPLLIEAGFCEVDKKTNEIKIIK
jgi:hypothetical protein